MMYIFISIIILVVAFSIYKMIVHKEYPIIYYTLYKDSTAERKHGLHLVQKIKSDVKLNSNYEEILHKK